ncbi:DUF2771 domain-containing protein [Streptomyces rectiverticillatus]|uniref:DUF2771 domain-containing protein n=1 Tax=Streptomyces rectiverticillatus TaxID=173860 RepID=UPI0015C341F7|nr:DUF2771 domain-containing protein [Streptomyces rectiverticillatus]QLE73483.1 DUF2771 domain-containing protein [Streptomyces rectiverticillatus]
MTAAIFRGKRRRAAAAVGAVAFGLVALSACEKPTPLATVTVGSTTVTTEAACFEEGKELDRGALDKCMADKSIKSVKVQPGDKVRVGVEPDMAEQGWIVVGNGQQQTNQLKQTYTSLDGEQLFVNRMAQRLEKSVVLSVITKDGVWNVKLELDKG